MNKGFQYVQWIESQNDQPVSVKDIHGLLRTTMRLVPAMFKNQAVTWDADNGWFRIGKEFGVCIEPVLACELHEDFDPNMDKKQATIRYRMWFWYIRNQHGMENYEESGYDNPVITLHSVLDNVIKYYFGLWMKGLGESVLNDFYETAHGMSYLLTE